MFLHHYRPFSLFPGPPFSSARAPPTTAPPTSPGDEEETKTSNCSRKFVCVHWELDPHLLLLSKTQWASGSFNPHISWLLETLGFKYARTTIPKYIQRGLMDPLDLGIASLVELLVRVSATKKIRMREASPFDQSD